MPWLEERTLILFVRDTEIRRYEPGVREGRVHVERRSSSSCTSGTCRTLTLERRRHSVVHRDRLVWLHDAIHYTSLIQHNKRLSFLGSFRSLHWSHSRLVVISQVTLLLLVRETRTALNGALGTPVPVPYSLFCLPYTSGDFVIWSLLGLERDDSVERLYLYMLHFYTNSLHVWRNQTPP